MKHAWHVLGVDNGVEVARARDSPALIAKSSAVIVEATSGRSSQALEVLILQVGCDIITFGSFLTLTALSSGALSSTETPQKVPISTPSVLFFRFPHGDISMSFERPKCLFIISKYILY